MTDGQTQDAPNNVPREFRKHLITQAIKWSVGLVALLISIAALGWWFYLDRVIGEYIVAKAAGIPSGAVVAFDLRDKCPSDWDDFNDARGRFILGFDSSGDGSRRFGSHGGQEQYELKAVNLPPHHHEVYRHAGEVLEKGKGPVDGAGGGDTNWSVRDGLSGPGPGKSVPYNVMPPYIALRFCKKR